ncbi:MAG TPA: alpha/beta hydrolase [Myxococcota bacterium]|nr:alpha/beta hydrolase [Myxococcota bacterium]
MASPELSVLVNMLRARPILPDVSVAEMRAGMEAMIGSAQLPAGLIREARDVNGVPAEWLSAPGSAADRAVLYLHGGGYVLGSIGTHRELAARISAASAARCLLIDYRLGPEHRFPAAVEDAVAAYRFLLDAGYAPGHLAIAGDSAGGGLTVATLLAIRDAKLPLPATGVCISPWVDLEGIGESMTTKADVDPMVQKAPLVVLAKHYLGGADPRSPLASPIYADLRGLPPLLVQVGTSETLLDDSTRLAERARRAGVEVELEAWPDMIHVWHAFAALLPEGREAIERVGAHLRKRLG